MDYDQYNPSDEDIKRICDQAYEENKELIDYVIKELAKNGD